MPDAPTRTAVCDVTTETLYGHRGIRLTSAEIDDLCYRHCEQGEPLTDEEIDRLIDTADTAHTLAEELHRARAAVARAEEKT